MTTLCGPAKLKEDHSLSLVIRLWEYWARYGQKQKIWTSRESNAEPSPLRCVTRTDAKKMSYR